MVPPNAQRRKQKRRTKPVKPVPSGDVDMAGDDLIDENDRYQSPASPAAGGYPESYSIPGQYEEDPPRKTKKKSKSIPQQQPYPPPPASLMSRLPPPPPQSRQTVSDETLRTMQRRVSRDPIWDTNSQEERARIKEFWLTLPEDDRKSLVKIEKEAVLRKMKEQQKHSCSCTVCGRKRTAIEEELEVLYDAYYDELEQFANNNQQMPDNGTPMLAAGTSHAAHPMSRSHMDSAPSRHSHSHSHSHSHGRIQEIHDDEDEDDDFDEGDLEEEEEDEYSDDDYDDEYTSNATDEAPLDPTPANDFFSFGKSLTVKGGILTVADDLLKNDGQKFIDMMEQLAERRMQREEDAAMAPYRMPHPPMGSSHPSHRPPPEEDEYSEDEEEYDDESQGEELDDDEDEMDTMTEEQRMEEGRRMFQIFAARMFEQRVLTAYKEKVARDRQEKLIAELEAETNADTARDAKKARDAEKRRQKKAQQKAAKAEEKAKKDAEKKAEEDAAKEAEEAKKEEVKKKRDEARKKKDAEKKAAEDERLRKEADKLRRQQLERDRQQESERKAREAKAEEKRKREEARQKEREEREAKEGEARRRKEQADLDKRKDKGAEDDKQSGSAAVGAVRADGRAAPPATSSQRAPPPSKIALPPGLKHSLSSQGQASPQSKVATPAAPKAPTPTKPREASQAQANVSHSHNQSRDHFHSPSTGTSGSDGPPTTHPSMSAPHAHHGFVPQPPHMQHLGPSPIMQRPNGPGLHGYPMGAFPGAPGMIPPGMAPRGPPGQHIAGYPAGPQPMNFTHRPFGIAPAGAPPGMPAAQAMSGMGRGFHGEAAGPGFHQPLMNAPGFAPPPNLPPSMSVHSRQPSNSLESPPNRMATDAPPSNQPITRPGPINRPTSTKPPDEDAEVDELGKHLGSSALLDDNDVPLPLNGLDTRRTAATPVLPPGSARSAGFGGSPFTTSPNSFNSVGGSVPSLDSWSRPSGAAGGGQAFGAFGGLPPAPGWGAPAPAQHHGGWSATNASYSAGSLPRGSMSRPVAVRQAACQACRNLAAHKGDGRDGGFHLVEEVVNEMRATGSVPNAPAAAEEIENILDTEGDAHNGGGFFESRRGPNGKTMVRWESAAPRGSSLGGRGGPLGGLGLGEIGSPLPATSSLHHRGGRI